MMRNMLMMVMMMSRRRGSSSDDECLWPLQLREPLAAQGCRLRIKAARAPGLVSYASFWPRRNSVWYTQRRRQPLASSACAPLVAQYFYHSIDGESPWPRQLREPLATQFFIKLYFCSRREPLASAAA